MHSTYLSINVLKSVNDGFDTIKRIFYSKFIWCEYICFVEFLAQCRGADFKIETKFQKWMTMNKNVKKKEKILSIIKTWSINFFIAITCL